MKNITYLLLFITFLSSQTVHAKVYKTKQVQGNYTASTTWVNNDIPPFNITGADTVIIDLGADINADANLSFNNVSAAFIINGFIKNSWSDSLIIKDAYMGGSGVANFKNATIDTRKPLRFSDSVMFSKVTFYKTHIPDNSKVYVSLCSLMDTMKVDGNALLRMGSEIYFKGGVLWPANTHCIKAVEVTLVYPVEAAGTTTGMELTFGKEIREMRIDVGAGEKVNLGSRLDLYYNLRFESGSLALNGHDAYLQCRIYHNAGGIFSTNQSNIYLQGSAVPQTIFFTAGGDTVNNLILNKTYPYTSVIGTDLNIAGQLLMTRGHLLMRENTLRLLPTASLQGGGDTSYIKMWKWGEMVQQAQMSQTAFYPVGTENYYLPVRIIANNATINELSIGAWDYVLDSGERGNHIYQTKKMVDATWRMHTNTANINVDMEVEWHQDLFKMGLNKNAAYISKNSTGTWDQVPYKSATHLGSSVPLSFWWKINRENITDTGAFSVFDSSSYVSVFGIEARKQVSCYPNPAKDVLHVQGVTHGETVEVYNSLGQLVQTEVLRNNSINVSALSAGVYYLTVDRKEKPAVISFVKQAQ